MNKITLSAIPGAFPGATAPKNTPNYNSLPNVEADIKPSRTNHTTTPVYTKDNP